MEQLIEKEQERKSVEDELISLIDTIERLIVESVDDEVYFSIDSQDYSIAWVESGICFEGKSGYRILQDGWGCVYSIHSTAPGIAKFSYADGGDGEYEIKHAPKELLRNFALNVQKIIETLQVLRRRQYCR